MSDNETGKVAAWTDREVLIYLLSTIEYSNAKLDYANAPTPPGRNTSGCVQKINKLKKALKNDIQALQTGTAVSNTKAKGKRRADDGEEKPKKRDRPKKAVEHEQKVKKEAVPEIEGMDGEDGAEEV